MSRAERVFVQIDGSLKLENVFGRLGSSEAV